MVRGGRGDMPRPQVRAATMNVARGGMSESLFNRVRRLVSADSAALLSTLSGPAGVAAMRRAIGEVGQAAEDARVALAEAVAGHRQAERQIKLTGQHLAQLAEKAELALSWGREELAAAALSRQIDLEAQLPLLEAAQAGAAAEAARLAACVEALEARRVELESELAAAGGERRRAPRPARAELVADRIAALKAQRKAG
jgi:phage shock protein A